MQIRKRPLKIVPDKSSYSGYSFMSLDEPDKPGIPASKFEVELWKELEQSRAASERLMRMGQEFEHLQAECENLRKIVDNLTQTLEKYQGVFALTFEEEMLRSFARDEDENSQVEDSVVSEAEVASEQ